MIAACLFLNRSQQQLTARREARRTFDLRARDASTALATIRAAAQAYVAEGQATTTWAPRVVQAMEEAGSALSMLRSASATDSARADLDAAAEALAEFGRIDGRAQDYLRSDQTLMASDLLFTDGGQAASDATTRLEAARRAEMDAADGVDAGIEMRMKEALLGAVGVVALIVLILGATKIPSFDSSIAAREPEISKAPHSEPGAPAMNVVQPMSATAAMPALPPEPADAAAAPAMAASESGVRALAPALRAAAEICTDFGCVRTIADVQLLLERAAEAMDAAGLIVWLGNLAGADLSPILTHGYTDDVRTRLPDVPRSADNATAAAYRSSEPQLVLPQDREPRSGGAIVAPILSPDGCIGAFSVEVHSGEPSETVQALAAIVAAQLSTVLEAAEAEVPKPRLAAS